MSQFLICEAKDLSDYGVQWKKNYSDSEFYNKVVNRYFKNVNVDNIWVIEEMVDMADELEKYMHIIDEISRKSDVMVFWWASDFEDLDQMYTRKELMDYLKNNATNQALEIYLYVDLKHDAD